MVTRKRKNANTNRSLCNWPTKTGMQNWRIVYSLRPSIGGRQWNRDDKKKNKKTHIRLHFCHFRTINSFELQELLDACLPNDYIKSCASIDICRQVVSLLDVSALKWMLSKYIRWAKRKSLLDATATRTIVKVKCTVDSCQNAHTAKLTVRQ